MEPKAPDTAEETDALPLGEALGSDYTRSPFPLIADYAFLSDCESTCLIAPSGAVEWMCVPRPDSPSVFTAMLDRSAGNFRLGPYDVRFPAARRYLPGSLMLETTWQTPTGWLIVRDALVMGPWHNVDDRSRTHRRSPTDFDAEHCLIRTVKCVSGTVDLAMSCEPVFDYGSIDPEWTYDGPGYGALTATSESSDLALRLTTDLRCGIEGRAIRATDPHGRGRAALRRVDVVAAARPDDLGRGGRADGPHR